MITLTVVFQDDRVMQTVFWQCDRAGIDAAIKAAQAAGAYEAYEDVETDLDVLREENKNLLGDRIDYSSPDWETNDYSAEDTYMEAFCVYRGTRWGAYITKEKDVRIYDPYGGDASTPPQAVVEYFNRK